MSAQLACLLVVCAGVLIGPGPGLAGDAQPEDRSAFLRGDGPHCPRGDQNGFPARRLIGKVVRQAKKAARRHDCTVRVVKRNGEALVITDDLRYNRINVAVRDRRVVRIRGVF